MKHIKHSDPLSHFSNFLRETLGELLDPRATTFVEMLAEDAIMEFPYTPQGGVPRVEGRASIGEYVENVAKMLTIEEMTLLAFHQATTPGTVIVEFTGKGSGVQTGKPYEQTYISVITLRDGYIARYRDYWNPLAALNAIGGADVIAATLAGEGENDAR